jgi:hypothetical protein
MASIDESSFVLSSAFVCAATGTTATAPGFAHSARLTVYPVRGEGGEGLPVRLKGGDSLRFPSDSRRNRAGVTVGTSHFSPSSSACLLGGCCCEFLLRHFPCNLGVVAVRFSSVPPDVATAADTCTEEGPSNTTTGAPGPPTAPMTAAAASAILASDRPSAPLRGGGGSENGRFDRRLAALRGGGIASAPMASEMEENRQSRDHMGPGRSGVQSADGSEVADGDGLRDVRLVSVTLRVENRWLLSLRLPPPSCYPSFVSFSGPFLRLSTPFPQLSLFVCSFRIPSFPLPAPSYPA